MAFVFWYYLNKKIPNTLFPKLLSNDNYMPEIIQYYDISLDPGTEFLQRCTKQYENRALHVHVFDFNLIVDCYKYFDYEILDMQITF
jgi:hypothetical protein